MQVSHDENVAVRIDKPMAVNVHFDAAYKYALKSVIYVDLRASNGAVHRTERNALAQPSGGYGYA